MDIKQLIGETTDYDKKVALETKKPKSWCKSISAFANCYGGKLVFGVANVFPVLCLYTDFNFVKDILLKSYLDFRLHTIMRVMGNLLHLCV